jgi:tetratricopeptide (TPR) repeat protein
VIKLPRRAFRITLALAALASLALPAAAQPQFGVSPITVTGGYLAGRQALDELHTGEAADYYRRAAEEDYDNPFVLEPAFVALAAAGEVSQSASIARHFLELDLPSDLARMIVATDEMRHERYDGALAALDDLGADSFIGLTGSILKAWAEVASGDLEAGFATLDGVGEGGLEDFLVFHRALMAEYAGSSEEAISLAAIAYDVNPRVARIVEAYARMLANDGKFDEATAVLDKFAAEGGTNPLLAEVRANIAAGVAPGKFTSSVGVGVAEMFHGLGVALASDGGNQTAVIFLRLGQYLNPRSDLIALLLGQIYDLADNHEEANRLYDAVPAASPMKPAAVIRMAENYASMDDLDEALRRLRNIVQADPANIDALAVLGDLERSNELWAESAATYSKLIERIDGTRPTDWRYFYVRGIAYERAKEWQKAEDDFKKALELNPEQPQVLNYLGYSWVDQGINLEPALEMIERAVAATPNDGYIIDSLGWAFYRLGRFDEAVVELEKAVRLLPNDPEINDHLGDAYWRAGRKLEARFQWTIASYVDEEGNVRERVAPKLIDPEANVGDGSEPEDEPEGEATPVVPEVKAEIAAPEAARVN